MSYKPNKFFKKWQRFWAKNGFALFKARDNDKKEKIYILDMFPYPSGEGLHVGHIKGYTATDVLARFYRMRNYNVLHPMGWDAFGLPAENYALKIKKPPQETVLKNIKHFKQQCQLMGFSYDWSREINTTDPNYYKWTQWIFLQMFKHGLAYEAEVPVNWCPSCKTVLADEEVSDNKCERCGTEVIRKKLRQWLLKITAYAERLLNDLDLLDWPESIKTMQRNWIGRSEGVEVDFRVENTDEYIKVFTTRIDTIFGATYLVLSPEHPLVNKITTSSYKEEVEKYQKAAFQKSEFERIKEVKEKTGIFTGAYAINPANKERLPIWVSDYVLMNYGTGAVMGVPAHDKRDWDFAKTFTLSIKEVISPSGKENLNLEAPYEGEGILINSGPFSGRNNKEAIEQMILYVGGKKTIHYKLRDWIFSRQRYWGEPIPIIKCERCGNVPLKGNQLPLKLPKIKKYEPTGTAESPLAEIKEWVNVKCPICKGEAKRETNTMPQWAGSSWYYLRYLDPKNKKRLADLKKEKYFMPVDVYIGGAEHAVLHLLYARFWHKFLYDLGLVSTKEPFKKLINVGVILGEDGEKMSKSRGNTVSPEEIIKLYGVDALRTYELFMGPLTYSMKWNTKSINGIYRFLNRVFNLVEEKTKKNKKRDKKEKLEMTKEAKKRLEENLKEIELIRHKTIKKVTEDIENFHFNTAISSIMSYLNKLSELPIELIERKHVETLVLLLSPFAPYTAEELWQNYLKHRNSVLKEKWPSYNKKLTEDKTFSLIVQINGKTRGKVSAQMGIEKSEAEKIALSLPFVNKHLTKKPKKVIFVKDRLINFVL
ncbi:MAG: leucine--tRNA ligase [Minisyncoccia bacterium]